MKATTWCKLHCKMIGIFSGLIISMGTTIMPINANAQDHKGHDHLNDVSIPAQHDSTAANAQHRSQDKATSETRKHIIHSHSYTLNTCPVSGAQLGSMGDPVVIKHGNREVRFCCNACKPKFDAEAETYLQKIDKQIIEAQKDLYPLSTCVVSGDTLGSMGEAVDYVHGGRLIRFCCNGCIDDFKSDPDKYLEKIDAAVVAKNADSYPLTACPVSGDALGGEMGEPVEYVFGARLVRLCCKGCVKDFEKNPQTYLNKIDNAFKLPANKIDKKKSESSEPPSSHGHTDHINHQ